MMMTIKGNINIWMDRMMEMIRRRFEHSDINDENRSLEAINCEKFARKFEDRIDNTALSRAYIGKKAR